MGTTTLSLPKYKYTNTQIHKYSFSESCTIWVIFLKRCWHEDLKNNVPDYLMCKYINTNTRNQENQENLENLENQENHENQENQENLESQENEENQKKQKKQRKPRKPRKS